MSKQPRRTAAAPISAHPAFPAIVALWFAALLGIGSLVLPIALFERASEASGLAGMIAAAQPPLGATARILIALAGGGIGAALGLAIARKVVAAGARPAARPGPAHPETATTAAKPPISAHAELFAGGFDADIDEPRGPLPGASHAPPEIVTEQESGLDKPLDLAGFDAPQPADLDARADRDPEAGEAATPERTNQAPLPAERPLAELGMAELVERFARALQQHSEHAQPTERAASARDTVIDLTRARAGAGQSGPEVAEHERDADEAADSHLPSLLAMKRPAASPRAPAIDGHGRSARGALPRQPAATEQALRDALAKLQRMSGAA